MKEGEKEEETKRAGEKNFKKLSIKGKSAFSFTFL